MPACVLHLGPHPDDESIAATATLLSLADHGHRIVNLACSLGRPAQQERRRHELEEACRRAGFELVVSKPPLGLSTDADADAAQRRIVAAVRELIGERDVDLVVSPSPHDRHPDHEIVGRAAREAVRRTPVRWWMWGLWGDLPLPTLYSAFDEPLAERVLHVLAAHRGELARIDYSVMTRGRAVVSRVLGSERVFGWGAAMQPQPFAELLTEVGADGDGFTAGLPRVLDPADPLPPLPGGQPLGWWLDAPSFGQAARAAGLEAPSTAAMRPFA